MAVGHPQRTGRSRRTRLPAEREPVGVDEEQFGAGGQADVGNRGRYVGHRLQVARQR